MSDTYEHHKQRLSDWSAEKILYEMERPKRQRYSLREIASFVAQKHKNLGAFVHNFLKMR